MSGALISVFANQRQFATVPGAPTIGTATASGTTASITFTPPASDGGSAITSYTATSSPGGLTGTSSGSPVTVSGLTIGTTYTFTVTATNAVGTGPASAASNSVTIVRAWILAYYSGAQTLSGNSGIYITSGQVINPFGSLGIISGLQIYSTITINASGSVTTQTGIGLPNNPTGARLSEGQRSYYDATNNFLYFGERINGTGNAYFNRRNPTSTTGRWRRRASLNFDTPNYAYSWSAIADSSQNSYFVGSLGTSTCDSGTLYAVLYKYDSGGTNQFMAKRWGNNNDTSFNAGGNVFKDVTLDGSSQPVVAGSIEQTTNRAYGVIIKYDTDGSLVWQTRLISSSANLQFNTIAKDSSYNYYVGGWIYTGSSGVVAKFNDSGTLQWQRTLTVSGTQLIIQKTRVDSSNNVFYLGSANTTNQPCYLFKYNSSGTLQWQRKITASFSLNSGNCDFAIDETDSALVVNFGTAGASGLTSTGMMMIIKYPKDGSITGTYSVGSSTLTVASGDATDSAGSFTSNAAASTNGTGASTSNFETNLDNTSVSYSSSLTNI